MSDEELLAELAEAEDANMHARDCQVCGALEEMSDQAKLGVERALSGTIGEKKLSGILTRSGYKVGARAIRRHRTEGHTS